MPGRASEQPEDRRLAGRAAAAHALAMAAEVALVDLDLAGEGLGRPRAGEDDLAQLAIEQDRAVAMDARQLRRHPRRRASHEVLHQTPLDPNRQP